jgi:hypothetical protein
VPLRRFAAVAALLAAAPALAQTADGALTLDARKVPLAHAFAAAEATIPEMSGEEAPGVALHVFLTDKPLPPSAGTSVPAVAWAAHEAGLRGVVLTLDPATGAILDGDTFLPDEERPRAFDFAGDPPQMRMTEFRAEGGRVSGRVATEGLIEGFHMEGDAHPKGYAVNAAFAAPYAPAPALVAVHDEAAARDSAPGAAAAAFLAALAAEDRDGALGFVPKDHPGRDFLAADVAQAREDFLGPYTPEEFVEGLFRLYEYEDRAVALFSHGEEGSLTSLPLVESGGRWLLGMP